MNEQPSNEPAQAKEVIRRLVVPEAEPKTESGDRSPKDQERDVAAEAPPARKPIVRELVIPQPSTEVESSVDSPEVQE